MAAWLDSHPRLIVRHRGGIKRFITGWLERSQNSMPASRTPQAPAATKNMSTVSIWRQRPAGAKGWVIEVTPQEFDFIRASIKSAYPTFNVMPDQYSIRMWYRMLGDLDYKLCETALMELFATHTYPPQISEIREKCAEYTVPHLKDQGEAWGEVQKAISQYGYYRQEEALESLTPIV